MWVVLLVLASCQNAAEDPGLSEAVPAQPDHPSLHTVPPRPQLSYTVEQRRAIVEGLIADRENARYSNQVVRYRAGLSGLPPPATPPVAAAPPAAPDVAATEATPPAPGRPDLPSAPPETEFDHYDDDLDSFLEDMERSGAAAPGPGAHAAPAGRAIVRAGAARPVAPPAADDDDGPEPATMGFPPAAPAAGIRMATHAPARVETSLAGRAPGVVWGMVDMGDRPAAPAAAASAARVAEPSGAKASSPAPAPDAATLADRLERAGRPPTDVAIAGRAPGVVWGMVDMPDMPDRPAEPAAAADAASAADTGPTAPPAAQLPPATPIETVETGSQDDATGGDGQTVEPTATALARRPEPRPPFEAPAGAAGIEISDGLIAISLAPGAERAGPPGIDFAPGSAILAPEAAARLDRFLAAVKAPDVRIRVVGEADAPALALDRALAVGIALVQRGVPADRLDLTLAPDPGDDQVRLSAVASAP
jgi:outer membrane protein OmpA-like peptidoglycan-associated protein